MQGKANHVRAWVLVGVLASLAIACRRAPAEEILVFAAASTTDALQEIANEYKAQTGHAVTFSFGASSTLARQIVAGGPADVFLSADRAQMDSLEKAGFVRKEDRKDLLSNQLVVVVPERSRLRIDNPRDLANATHVATADPKSVPVGVYARQWLEGLGLWSTLEPKVVPTLDVRAALAAVESERAEVGIVYRTDAAMSQKVRIVYAVPIETGPPIVYPVARVAASKKSAAAEFVSYLTGPTAKAIFTRYGFITL
jgi:molybdate transport system substrate-binding protein